jgi:hypothetical protein
MESKNYNSVFSFVILIASSTFLNAQSIPVGSIPIFYNGGFAGEAGAARIAGFSYFESGGKSRPSISNIISYDNFFKSTRLGIGVMVGQSNVVYDFYSQNSFAKISLSPKFSFKGKYTFAPFLDLSLGGLNASGGAGVLINSLNGYIGLTFSSMLNAVRHSNTVYFPFIQAGYTFRRTPESKFSFTPQMALGYTETSIQRNYFHKDLNLTFRYKKLIWGANLYSGGFMIGFQNSNFKIQLNQSLVRRYYTDIKASDQGNFYNCSLSIRYIFKIAKPGQF